MYVRIIHRSLPYSFQHPLVHPSIHPSIQPSIHPASQPTIQTFVRVREEDAAEIPSLPISIATTKASLCARMHERTAITPALSHKLIIRPPRLLEYLSYSSQKFQTLNAPLFPVSCPRPSDALPLPAFHKRRISRAVQTPLSRHPSVHVSPSSFCRRERRFPFPEFLEG